MHMNAYMHVMNPSAKNQYHKYTGLVICYSYQQPEIWHEPHCITTLIKVCLTNPIKRHLLLCVLIIP